MVNSFKHTYKYLNSGNLKSDWTALAKEINTICQTKISSVKALEQHLFTLNELDILVKDHTTGHKPNLVFFYLLKYQPNI